jgi:hypothetical protein
MKFGIFYKLQLPRPWEPDSGSSGSVHRAFSPANVLSNLQR